MNNIETNTVKAITAKAKASWKKDIKRKKDLKAKNSKKTAKISKKRNIKDVINKNDKKNQPPAKKQKLNNKKKKKRYDYDLPLKEQKKRSVIKLQNMPSGMEDRQISIFFSQFGNITRFCLKRHRYGRSLRYGYVEFDDHSIGKILEDTLDCTSMYGQMIICKEIEASKVNGSQFFKNHSIQDARICKKFDNEKVRWHKSATIANLEFKFNDWYNNLIADQQIINDNLIKNGIDYQFNGFEKEIKRQIEKDNNTKPIANNNNDL